MGYALAVHYNMFLSDQVLALETLDFAFYIDRQTDRQADGQIDRQTDRSRQGRQTNKRIDRHTDTQADRYTHTIG